MNMKPLLLAISVAHTHDGQDENATKENELSKAVSNDLAYCINEHAHGDAIEAVVIEEWRSGRGSKSRKAKIKEVNKLVAKSAVPVLAIEIHWNNPKNVQAGTAVLYHATSDGSKAIAEGMMPVLRKKLGRGQHYIGAIPFPSPYRQAVLQFLQETRCKAVIIEIDALRFADEWEDKDTVIKTVNGLFDAILEVRELI